MGAVISYFRKNEPIELVLERIEQNIQGLNKNNSNVRSRWHSWIRKLLIWSFTLEIIYFAIYYLAFYGKVQQSVGFVENSKMDLLLSKLFYVSPLILIPLVTLFLRRIINFWFGKSIANYEKKLAALKLEQSKKLEEFAAATNFYKTQALMNKYGRATKPASPSPQKVVRTPSKLSQPPSNLSTPLKSASNNANFATPSKEVSTPVSAPVSTPSVKTEPKLKPSAPPQEIDISSTPKKPQSSESELKQRNVPNSTVKEEAVLSTPRKNVEPVRYVMSVPKEIIAAEHAPRVLNPPKEQVKMGWFDSVVNYLVGPEYNQVPPTAEPHAPLEHRMAAILEEKQREAEEQIEKEMAEEEAESSPPKEEKKTPKKSKKEKK